MIIGVPKETFPGEKRVALVPGVLPALTKAGLEVLFEAGAGAAAGFPDDEYTEKSAKAVSKRAELYDSADVLLQVRGPGANPEASKADLKLMRSGQVVVGLQEPLDNPQVSGELAEQGIVAFAMELMPRITRAQSMDALSSMATVAGYKAVLMAAEALPKMFPMLMTAAGTVAPAHAFIVGAGVAGLQAIATAHRLGALVKAYDVRPEVKEQVESLGARFVELPLEVSDAEDKGGYAKAMGEEFYRRQRETMAKVVVDSDVVITTALVPGKKAPVLITKEMVQDMQSGSVIVDLAAETGGNCELTKADETVLEHGVTILGPTNIPSTVPYHASQMYAKNISNFILHLVKDGKVRVDPEDEITRETLVCRDGQVVHPRVRQALGLEVESTLEGKGA